MKITNSLCFNKGFDINVFHTWYGLHYYWQSSPLFDIINSHRKMNTLHKYGIIIFGLWLYIRIDQ
jgi:hypothetical protein